MLGDQKSSMTESSLETTCGVSGGSLSSCGQFWALIMKVQSGPGGIKSQVKTECKEEGTHLGNCYAWLSALAPLSSPFPLYSLQSWTPGHRKPNNEFQVQKLPILQFSTSPHLGEVREFKKGHITLFHTVKDKKGIVFIFICHHYHILSVLLRVTCGRHDKYERLLKIIFYVTIESVKRHFSHALWVYKCF